MKRLGIGRRPQQRIAAADDLADATSHRVAHDGAAESSTGRDADAVVVATVGHEADDHQPTGACPAVGPDAVEVATRAEGRHGTRMGPAVRR